MDGMSFTRRQSLSWTALSETIGVGAMGLPEEDLEVELPPQGDNIEEIFILGKETKEYLKEKW